MAYYPCDMGGHPFPGKSSTLYIAESRLGGTSRTKMRLCRGHADVVKELLEPCEVNDESIPLAERHSFPCLTDGGETSPLDRRMVFVTAYFVNQNRRDFWAMIHDSCPLPPLLSHGQPEEPWLVAPTPGQT